MDLKTEKKLKNYFDQFTAKFSQAEKLEFDVIRFEEYGITIPIDDISEPHIVFIIFVYLKEFKFLGNSEKIAWEIPLYYNDIVFLLSHRKFGFRVSIEKYIEDIDLIIEEMVSNIKKAIPYAEKLIEPKIKQKVNEGNITIDNEYNAIRRKYIFFKELVIKEFSAPLEDYTLRQSKPLYYASAMFDAYFSLLEHTFVLLLPFINDSALETIVIENFIVQNWKEKYKTIFQLQRDVRATQFLEKLKTVKDMLRNPLAHGNFLKDGGNFLVHMEHLGAIPIKLTKKDKKINYSLKNFTEFKFEEICKIFDDFESFIENHIRIKYGILYIKSGLPVSFDKETKENYLNAMSSETVFKEFMHDLAMDLDNASNMDW